MNDFFFTIFSRVECYFANVPLAVVIFMAFFIVVVLLVLVRWAISMIRHSNDSFDPSSFFASHPEILAELPSVEVASSSDFSALFHSTDVSEELVSDFPIGSEIDSAVGGKEKVGPVPAKMSKAIRRSLLANEKFFDRCLTYPLDEQQRRCIVSEADNCLVISSAGCGKTSTIVGKVKYLIELKKVDPSQILLISYTNKAAAELTQRLDIEGLKGYTFHKLAIDIIGKATGHKPSICERTDALFSEAFHNLLAENKQFRKNVMEYFLDYEIEEEDWRKRWKERLHKLQEKKEGLIKATFPDMDGNPIYVRSKQEKKICFLLSSLGVDFRYEEPYEFAVDDETHSQYKPDFSIHYQVNGQPKRIYLEHFGVDVHGKVPEWFAQDKNMTYDEANKQYNDGITWKKAAHKKYGTTLLVTSSADFYFFNMKSKLRNILQQVGVPIHEKTENELYDTLLPVNSKQEKAFIRLVATFINLMKSSCRTMEETLDLVNQSDDERSKFIIQKIFLPVYIYYVRALKEREQVDFTDLILEATELSRKAYRASYDYIIVDEFQDISVDRYEFLKVLRDGKRHAQLYCVGDDWQSIYRFSGSDVSLFKRFTDFFGPAEINKLETTYRFGEPLIEKSSYFIQRNKIQLKKNLLPYNLEQLTELRFCPYERQSYAALVGNIIETIPSDKSVIFLGRYSFDDYYLSFHYHLVKKGERYFYLIGKRAVEFLTVHRAKGLEADYVIVLQCNRDTYGFPSLVNDDPVLNYVLTAKDEFPFGEERRLFYVAITRAKLATLVLYDYRFPSAFVTEFLHPEYEVEEENPLQRNANKRWTSRADDLLLELAAEGKSIPYIAHRMGRSQASVKSRLAKLRDA